MNVGNVAISFIIASCITITFFEVGIISFYQYWLFVIIFTLTLTLCFELIQPVLEQTEARWLSCLGDRNGSC
jgi:hypothetical protein